MKRYIIIIASALCAAGCADMLNTAPDNQIASGNMWTTEALADKGMVGLYSALYNKNMSDAHFDKIKSGINRAGIEALGFATDYYGGGHQVLLLSDAAKKASDFQLSYDLPERWIRGFASSVRISAYASNPLQIKSKDFKGRDPEVAMGSQPRERTFSIGLDINF